VAMIEQLPHIAAVQSDAAIRNLVFETFIRSPLSELALAYHAQKHGTAASPPGSSRITSHPPILTDRFIALFS